MEINKIKSYMSDVVSDLIDKFINIPENIASPLRLCGVIVNYNNKDYPIEEIAIVGSPNKNTLTIIPDNVKFINSILNSITSKKYLSNLVPVINKDHIICTISSLSTSEKSSLTKQVELLANTAKVDVNNIYNSFNKPSNIEITKHMDGVIKMIDKILEDKKERING